MAHARRQRGRGYLAAAEGARLAAEEGARLAAAEGARLAAAERARLAAAAHIVGGRNERRMQLQQNNGCELARRLAYCISCRRPSRNEAG